MGVILWIKPKRMKAWEQKYQKMMVIVVVENSNCEVPSSPSTCRVFYATKRGVQRLASSALCL